MRFLVRLLINACALWVATQLVRGVTFNGDVLPFLGVALIFGVINATIRPVAKILTFPLIIVTLGIFALVVNGLMLWLTSRLSGTLRAGLSRRRLRRRVPWRARGQRGQHAAVALRARHYIVE